MAALDTLKAGEVLFALTSGEPLALSLTRGPGTRLVWTTVARLHLDERRLEDHGACFSFVEHLHIEIGGHCGNWNHGQEGGGGKYLEGLHFGSPNLRGRTSIPLPSSNRIAVVDVAGQIVELVASC